MLTFLSYFLTFAAGFIACDLVRAAQEHLTLTRITRVITYRADPPDVVLSCWSADPNNLCDKPGCPRCWNGWDRS